MITFIPDRFNYCLQKIAWNAQQVENWVCFFFFLRIRLQKLVEGEVKRPLSAFLLTLRVFFAVASKKTDFNFFFSKLKMKTFFAVIILLIFSIICCPSSSYRHFFCADSDWVGKKVFPLRAGGVFRVLFYKSQLWLFNYILKRRTGEEQKSGKALQTKSQRE